MASPDMHQMNADECIKRLGPILLSESQGGKRLTIPAATTLKRLSTLILHAPLGRGDEANTVEEITFSLVFRHRL